MMNNNLYYTDEQNAQMLLFLLKKHGIKRVIVSPGATNVAFVASMQHDSFFEMYSCVDERSAAYMACGMAEECGEPVVLSCTGATSSRNYMPGLTEAYYRKLPILVVTSSMDNNRKGHLYAQFTNRDTPPVDCVKKSFYIQWIKDKEDSWDCTIKLNNAILSLYTNDVGPIHVNLVTRFSTSFNVRELPPTKYIYKYTIKDKMPSLPSGKVAVFIGQHKKMTDEEINAIDAFCLSNNAIVLTDHTSNYKGAFKILPALIASQERENSAFFDFDLVIHIGEISGEYYILGKIRPKEVWRVAIDGQLRDRFKKLSCVFEMEEKDFFLHYSKTNTVVNEHNIEKWRELYTSLRNSIPDLPFSTLWVSKELSSRIPSGATLYLSILNVLRSWNFFELNPTINTISNVGGFGIDGMTSSLLGASLVNPQKLYFGVTGDLNFFYDMNSLGNRHVGNNIRLMLINNGHGQEFRTYKHNASILGEEADEYIAAARHFGNKSSELVKFIAQNLGFRYLSASTKDEFLKNIEEFVSETNVPQSLIFEVFTDNDAEYTSLKLLQNIEQKSASQQIKESVRNLIGEDGVKLIKKIIK